MFHPLRFAVRFIELFAEYYCDSKNLLRMKHDAEHIPNNCKITVPLQPVEGILELQAYKDLATEVASYREPSVVVSKGLSFNAKPSTQTLANTTPLNAL